MRRHEIPDRRWAVVAALPSSKPADRNVVTAVDNRSFFNVVVWLMRSGVPWADLPEWFDKFNSVCRRLGEVVRGPASPQGNWVMLDLTVLQARQYAPHHQPGLGVHRQRRVATVFGHQPGCAGP